MSINWMEAGRRETGDDLWGGSGEAEELARETGDRANRLAERLWRELIDNPDINKVRAICMIYLIAEREAALLRSRMAERSGYEDFVKHLETAHNVLPNRDGRPCNLCRFEEDSGIIRDPVNGWAIRNDQLAQRPGYGGEGLTRTLGWDERDYKLWSALGVLPSYGRKDRTDHLISLQEVEALLRKHAEERYDQKNKTSTRMQKLRSP